MKKFMQKSLAIALLFVSSFSYAQGDASEEVCGGFREAAGGMMALRQYDRPLSEAIEIQEEIFSESAGDEVDVMFNDILHEIIMHAYSVDVATDDTQKIRNITGFANTYYTVCIQELEF